MKQRSKVSGGEAEEERGGVIFAAMPESQRERYLMNLQLWLYEACRLI